MSLGVCATALAATVALPAGLQVVAEEAFYGDASLQWVVIPAGTERIGSRAFANCTGLRGVEIPGSVQYIAPDAFAGSPLAIVRAEEGSYAWTFAFEHGMLLRGTDGALLGKAGAGASFRFSDGVLTISGTGATSSGAGQAGAPWASLRGEIREIVIEEGVTALSMKAFAGCPNLVSATIAASVSSVSQNAFQDSPLLFIRAQEGSAAQAFATAHGIPWVELNAGRSGSAGEGVEYSLEEGTLTISGAGEIGDALTASMRPWYPFREEIGRIVVGEQVSRIGAFAFADCPSLTSVSIPDSVTGIDGSAFSGAPAGLELHGHAGSFAQSWAGERGFTFRAHARIVRQPESLVSLYNEETVTVAIEATGDGLQYQWQEYFTEYGEWYDIGRYSTSAAPRQASYTAVHGDDEDGYGLRCRVTDAYGDVVYSESATLHFKKPVRIVKHPGSFLCSVGDTVVFGVEATGDGLTYEWQMRINGTGEWRFLGSDRTLSVVYKGNDKNIYQCVVRDMYGNSERSFWGYIKTATVISGPEDLSLTSGDRATFQILAEGKSLQYQWQYYSSAYERWFDFDDTHPRTDSLSFTARLRSDGLRVRCRVTDAYDYVQYSREATLGVEPYPITLTDPQDAQVVEGESVSLRVAATGYSLRYQWQMLRAGEETWYNIAERFGALTDTLTFTPSHGANNWQYRCVVTDADGVSRTSRAAKLTVVVPVTGIQISRGDFTSDILCSVPITASVVPSYAGNQNVTWSSDAPDIVSVAYAEGDDGTHRSAVLICGTTQGTATITATSEEGGFTASCTVTVSNMLRVDCAASQRGSLETDDASIHFSFRLAGGSHRYRLTGKLFYLPRVGGLKIVRSFSSGEEFSEETAYGIEKAPTLGGEYFCVVEATDSTGCTYQTATERVLVERRATGVSLSTKSYTLNKGGTHTLRATILPEDATNGIVFWTISDPAVASLEGDTLTALAGGTAVLTAQTADGGFTDSCTINVRVPLTGVSLDQEDIDLEVGASYRLLPSFTPEDTTEGAVSAWWSSDTSVTVEDGLVTAQRLPSDPSVPVVITAATGYGPNVRATCNVHVTRTVTGLTLDRRYLELTRGETHALVATLVPADTTQPGVLWSSSDESVARVSSTGEVSAVGAGVATITAKTLYGGYTCYCGVAVTEPLSASITAKRTMIELQGDIEMGGFDAYVTGGVKPYTVRFELQGGEAWGWNDSFFSTVSSYSYDVQFFRRGLFRCHLTVTDYAGHSIAVDSEPVYVYHPIEAETHWSHEPVHVTDLGFCELTLEGGLPGYNVEMELYRVGQVEPLDRREWRNSDKTSFHIQTPFDEIDLYYVLCTVSDATGLYYEVRSSTVYAQQLLVSYIFVSPYRIGMYVGDSIPLRIDVYPEQATNNELYAVCTDWDVIDLDENGCVYARSPGTATLTLLPMDGGVDDETYATVTVTVYSLPEPKPEPEPDEGSLGVIHIYDRELPQEYEDETPQEETQIVVTPGDTKHYDSDNTAPYPLPFAGGDDDEPSGKKRELPDINMTLIIATVLDEEIICYPLGTEDVLPYVEETLDTVGDIDGARSSARIFPTDELYLLGVGRTEGMNWARVSYPTSKGRKIAYISLWDVIDGCFKSKCAVKGDFYISNKRGSDRTNIKIHKGDTIYILSEDTEYCQFLCAPTNGHWRIGWCTQDEKNGIVRPFDPVWPCAKTYTISTLYNYSLTFDRPGAKHGTHFENGIDIAAPEGEAVYACESGKVIEFGYSTTSGFGNYILILHDNGMASWYAHPSAFDSYLTQAKSNGVKEIPVTRGQIIGYVGHTSAKYKISPHLHFELADYNASQAPGDPWKTYFREKYKGRITYQKSVWGPNAANPQDVIDWIKANQ